MLLVGSGLRTDLAALGRDRTTCGPNCRARATLAGRGKALPCTPQQEGAAKPRPYPMKETAVGE